MSDLAALAISVADAARNIRNRTGFVVDGVTGCWISAARGPGGLGPFRAFFVAAFGEPPDGFRIVHTCSGATRGCVRPAHMDVLPHGVELPIPRGEKLDEAVAGIFAARIRAERDARGATVAQFARELRVATSTLRAWEKATSAPDTQHYGDIAHQLGWDGRPRRFVVTVVVQRVVTATSAGAAALDVRDELERDDQPGKVHVAGVRVVR